MTSKVVLSPKVKPLQSSQSVPTQFQQSIRLTKEVADASRNGAQSPVSRDQLEKKYLRASRQHTSYVPEWNMFVFANRDTPAFAAHTRFNGAHKSTMSMHDMVQARSGAKGKSS